MDDAEKELERIQSLPISAATCDLRIQCEKKLDDLHSKHEAYWYLRSRVAEVRDGDRNSKYFHHKAS